MKYLVTSALPYANGPLHFGHLAGAYLPADIIVRHKKLIGHRVKFISGSDEHGVAIMLNAQKDKIDYKKYVDGWHKEHLELFKEYSIDFDFFGQTSSDYHEKEVIRWFNSLNEKGFIEPRESEQLYCKDCSNHLPDRFVEGECYECGFESARGDECPKCGIWIDAVKLKNPVCKMCGSHNIETQEVTQYYLVMSKFHSNFRDWFKTKKESWKKTVYPFIDSLTAENLHDRAITRDLDWGIDVPLAEAKGKKLYVWFDAPIGYISNTKKHLEEIGSDEDYLKDWWKSEDTKIVNFIGKDNIIFHGVIFPMMSLASGIANPVDDLPANQYLNLEGKGLSKSTGWYIDAKEAFNEFGQDALRYYLIHLIPETADSSFSWDNFQDRVNGELANNIGNLVNRCLKFWAKNWKDGIDSSQFKGFSQSEFGSVLKDSIRANTDFLDNYQIRRAMEEVMTIGHQANNFFSEREPWAQFKTDPDKAAQTIAWTSIYIMVLSAVFGPYLPELSGKIKSLFGEFLDDDLIKDIYSGKISALEKKLVSMNVVQLAEVPKVLVPKIEDDQIAVQKEKLSKLDN